MALDADQVLNNRYRIMKPLGEGGFGEVYQAWDIRLDACCAVKRNLQPSQEARRQFEQEARMLFKLIHPNLPRVHDYFTGAEDEQYLVMDFVEGENLREYIHRIGTPLIEQSLVWIDQVCDALNYLHTRQPPVVHRDIKPANIIITPEGKAMLVDFGIAKADPQMRTLSGARAWTPGYAPPEQYGQGRTDARSDVYSLAATAYAMLTGASPPDAMDVAAGSMKPARPAHEVNPAIPAHVGRAIGKAMQFNREQRTPSAEEFRQALRRRTKPAAEKVIILETQKTILEPRPEIPAAPVPEKPLVEEESQPPALSLPFENPLEEEPQPKVQSLPIEKPLKEEEPNTLVQSLLIEEALIEEVPQTPVQPLLIEEALIEAEPQTSVQSLPIEEPLVEEVPQTPVQSLPIQESLIEKETQTQAQFLPAANLSVWQKLGWKGIAGILVAVVILIIVMGALWNPTDPQISQKTADMATWAAMTQQFEENVLVNQTATLGGEPTATAMLAETAAVLSATTATAEARRQTVEAYRTATVQTLSRFMAARTATALSEISATETAAVGETLMTPTATLRAVIKTPTPTPTKKPKKRDDSQITLEPGITLVP